MVMPGGMNGFELAEQAIENRSDLRVLLTSGHAEKAKGKKGLQTNLLMKPYTHADLARRVRSLLSES
jgi:two-component SAPR family response regulator